MLSKMEAFIIGYTYRSPVNRHAGRICIPGEYCILRDDVMGNKTSGPFYNTFMCWCE